MIKKIRVLLLSLLLLPLAVFAAGGSAQPLDRVVAVVNDEVITQSQLNTDMQAMQAQFKGMHMAIPPRNQLEKKVLDQLILKKLQLQLAQRMKITATDAQVDAAINKMAEQNKLTLDQLKKVLAQEGFDYKKYRQQIHDQIIIGQLQQNAVGKNINISEQEIKNFMRTQGPQITPTTQFHFIDFLIPLNQPATPAQVQDAKKQADALAVQLRKGDVKQLGNVQRNDLGLRPIAGLPDLFIKQAQTMTKNSVSAPIQAPNGFHILKLVDLKNMGSPLTTDQARNLIYQHKIQGQLQIWLQQLRSSAYVKVTL